jgi:probable rRNA maturation factor
MKVNNDFQINFQINFQYAHPGTIPSEDKIYHWLNTARAGIPEVIEPAQAALVIRFISKEESAALNETYRHKNGPTNVLAFEDKPLAGLCADTLGDLAICVDIVAEEAQAKNKHLDAHWAHLIIHGFLHLMGYDHIEENDALDMEAREAEILNTLGFPNPYA